MKIVFTGTESTGKSTLSATLAEALQLPCVAEAARAYLEGINRSYVESDLLEIARMQRAAEEEALRRSATVICDTDLYTVKVWSEHRFGRCHRWILEELATHPADYYVLCAPLPNWTPDPLREYPDPRIRHYFHNVYFDMVQQSGAPFTLLDGPGDNRMNKLLHDMRLLLQYVN